MTEGQQPGVEPQIMIDPAHMAGVWANFARVSHSPYEFTLDFARLDYSSNPPQGIVVARVSLSPLMVTQLIDALGTNWNIYAERSMPAEVQRHGQTPDDGSAEGPAPDAPNTPS
jgi:hypothetical protein